MGRLFTRVRRATELVRKSINRDLLVRRISSWDEALAGGPAGRVRLAARKPFSQRTLPAVAVPLRSDAAHAATTVEDVTACLRESGVRWVRYGEERAGKAVIGVLADDWVTGLQSILRSVDGALVGLGKAGEHASRVAYCDDFSRHTGLERADVSYVLVPAVTVVDGRAVKRYGFNCAIRVERWEDCEGSGELSTVSWNPRTPVLHRSAFENTLEGRCGLEGADVPEIGTPHLMEVSFPIDAVYTWVDGTDPKWLERKRQALELNAGHSMPEAAADDLRFVGHDELRYSLRSLENYAPWIRHVYIVTDGQRPDWLRDDTDWVSVVDHRDIAPEGTELPTFNSQAIEANLHRIDGLSEHFLYFNDDMFLSSPVSPDLFFHANGLASVFLSRALVAPGDPVEGEPAPDAAGKNARDLVWQVCGRRLSRKLFHAPYALNTTISQEIEDRWPETVQRTRDSQFRRLEDITLAGGLHLNYAYAVGRAVTRKIRYRYVGIGEESAASELERLIKDKDSLQTFCLNDAVQDIAPDVADRQVREFLERRFPDMGSFERLPE